MEDLNGGKKHSWWRWKTSVVGDWETWAAMTSWLWSARSWSVTDLEPGLDLGSDPRCGLVKEGLGEEGSKVHFSWGGGLTKGLGPEGLSLPTFGDWSDIGGEGEQRNSLADVLSATAARRQLRFHDGDADLVTHSAREETVIRRPRFDSPKLGDLGQISFVVNVFICTVMMVILVSAESCWRLMRCARKTLGTSCDKWYQRFATKVVIVLHFWYCEVVVQQMEHEKD